VKTEVESRFDVVEKGFVVGWGIAGEQDAESIGAYVGLYSWHREKNDFGWRSMSAAVPTTLPAFISNPEGSLNIAKSEEDKWQSIVLRARGKKTQVAASRKIDRAMMGK